MSAKTGAWREAPDPRWGQQLFGPEERHLAVFDAWRDKVVRQHRIMSAAGAITIVGGLFVRQAPGVPGAATGVAFGVGLVVLLIGVWIPFRISFALHRRWGVYERGFVADYYRKGGFLELVPWTEIKMLRFRRMKLAPPAQGECFLIRAIDKRGFHHRIWETSLLETWGMTKEEATKFKEGFLAAARQHVPADRLEVEEELSEDGTP